MIHRRLQRKKRKFIQALRELSIKNILISLCSRMVHMNVTEWKQLTVFFIVVACVYIGEYKPALFTYPYTYARNVVNGEMTQVQYHVLESNFDAYPKTIQTNTIRKNGVKFLYSQTTEGANGFTYANYVLVYDTNGKLMDRIKVSKDLIQEAANIEYQRGSKVKKGAYFYVKYSRYGVDCAGCSGEKTGIGNFAAGIHYEAGKGVRQYDGTYKKGVTYEGYYIVAADRSIPFCTIMEIENHRWEGAGIKNNEPFQVIVLDRGGAIRNNRLDLFIGLQSDMEIGYGKWKTNKRTKATIIGFGKWGKNELGQYACKLNKRK